MKNIARLRGFIQSFTRLIDHHNDDEQRILKDGRKLLSELINHDDWLPNKFAQPSSKRYQQYLLHCDVMERFCIVSFVWEAGQSTPIHDHTVWGMIGIMRGAEVCEEFALNPETKALSIKRTHQLSRGSIDIVSPSIGDLHRVSNALLDRSSVSIHIYGTNIGTVNRHIYDEITGSKKAFISGYSNNLAPNIWLP